MLIPQNNPSLSLVDFFDERQGFLYEACSTCEETVWTTMIEREIMHHFSVEGKAILLRSPIEAFALALRLSGIRKEDIVLFPTNGRVEFAHLLLSLGLEIILIDMDPRRLSVSSERIKHALSDFKNWGKRRKTFLLVDHFMGITPNVLELKETIDREQLLVIENATNPQCLSREGYINPLGGYKIVSLGEFADGIGNAGTMLLCPTEERCQRGKNLLRNLSINILPDPVVPILRSDIRITSMQLIRAFIEKNTMAEKEQRRRILFLTYQKELKNILGLDLFGSYGNTTNEDTPFRIILSVDNALLHFSKNELVIRLQEKDIEAISFVKPLHLLPNFKKFPRYLNGLAEGWYDKAMLLPCGSGLTIDKVTKVTNEILDFVRHFN